VFVCLFVCFGCLLFVDLVISIVVINSNEMISFVEQSHAAEANGPSSSQNIPHIVWDLKVHYGVYKNLQLVSFLSQVNPVCTLPTMLFRTYFKNTLPSSHRSSKWFVLFGFLIRDCVWFSVICHVCHMACSFNPPGFDHPNNLGGIFKT